MSVPDKNQKMKTIKKGFEKIIFSYDGKCNIHYSGTNKGGADIYLILRSESATKAQLSSSVYYTYAHQIVGTSISLSASGGSVSISGGSYDYQAKIYNY